jgi:hypothetical protein
LIGPLILLASALFLSGCFYALDGSLVNKKKDQGVDVPLVDSALVDGGADSGVDVQNDMPGDGTGDASATDAEAGVPEDAGGDQGPQGE